MLAVLDGKVEVLQAVLVPVGGQQRVTYCHLSQDVIERHGLLLGARAEVTCSHFHGGAAMRHPAVVALEADEDRRSVPVHGPAGLLPDAVAPPVEDLVAQVVGGLDGIRGCASRAVEERGADVAIVSGRDDGLLRRAEHAHAVLDVRVRRCRRLQAQLRVLAQDVVGES